MKSQRMPGPLVLGIYPAPRGCGFALLEGPLRPVDWGVKCVDNGKNAACLQKVAALVDLYHPDVLVVDDYTGEGSRRGRRTQLLIDSICFLALRKNIPVCGYSPKQVRVYFSHYNAWTKHDIAVTIAEWMPMFQTRLPPERKPWASESYRMCMFDAIALVLTHYYYQRRKEV
jgi:Holliday junction resolvasome RuvABC endonuclease subunit